MCQKQRSRILKCWVLLGMLVLSAGCQYNQETQENSGVSNSFICEYKDKKNAVLHRNELTIRWNHLAETSRLKEHRPAISAKHAIDLAESELENCQFMQEEIAWTIEKLLLHSQDVDGKRRYCWIVTFVDADDISKDYDQKYIKIGVLLDGTTLLPTFEKYDLDPIDVEQDTDELYRTEER